MVSQISFKPENIANQKKEVEKRGLKKLEFRKAIVQLHSATKIKYTSLYAKQASSIYVESSHLSAALWQVEQSCSPMYKSFY